MKLVKFAFFLLLAVGAFFSWQTYDYFQAPLPMTSYRIVTVTAGNSLRSIGEDLQSKEIISSVDVFIAWARLLGHDKKIKTGEYGIPLGTSMAGLFKILLSGKSIGYRVVVPEGTNMYDVADLLEQSNLCKGADFMKVVTDRRFIKSVLGENLPSLEGYLFPDTYFFTKIDGAKLIAHKMVTRFLDKVKRVPSREGWSRHEMVTLASIIEKETGVEEERPQISSVFHNRLNKEMRLQTDPTVLYGKFLRTGDNTISITRADLTTDTPYNTYTRKGLPPGPISNPGVEAMQAAMSPATTDYLFFVSRNDGTHVFTTTYKDHSSAVTRFQLDAKAREGKSWRQYKKAK